MKTQFMFASAMLVAIGVGALGVEALYGHAKPPVYMI